MKNTKLWIISLIALSFFLWFLLARIWNTNNELDITREQDSFVFPTPKVVTSDPFASESSGFVTPN